MSEHCQVQNYTRTTRGFGQLNLRFKKHSRIIGGDDVGGEVVGGEVVGGEVVVVAKAVIIRGKINSH